MAPPQTYAKLSKKIESIELREIPMTTITLYHNPRCSKSRQALQLLQENGIEPNIIEYLKTPPNKNELEQLLSQLGLTARELMRKKEAPYKELDLNNNNLSEAKLIQAIMHNPILIERPIASNGKHAIIGRPPENILELIK